MTLKGVELFQKMAPVLEKDGAAIVGKVGAVYLWELRAKKGDQPTYVTIDLKNGNGSVTMGKGAKPDATFIMLDGDFMKLAGGKIKPQDAFMTGKMKIKGNMALAQKFGALVDQKKSKL